jgi:hypothetical protein
MSYLFLYQYTDGTKWGPSESISHFNFKIIDEITTNAEYHYNSYYTKSKHYLHAIANVALDYDLQGCGILEIEDDIDALTLRIRHDEFLIGDKVKLSYVYANPDFDEILDGCPLLKAYADRGATKRSDTKYVTKVANAVEDVARSVRGLNGALGDDFEKKFGELATLCDTRIAEYKTTNKNNASALLKERKLMRKRLTAFSAKEL